MDLGDELKLAWKYGLPAASALAILVYGLLRQLYATFYGRLGAFMGGNSPSISLRSPVAPANATRPGAFTDRPAVSHPSDRPHL